MRTSVVITVLATCGAGLLPGCGGAPPPVAERLPHHLEHGDRAVFEKRWDDAAIAYRRAFRLVDPTPENEADRGYLAYRIGRALVQSARFPDTAHPPEEREDRQRWSAREARIWLGEAEALAPDLRRVLFERAQLLDSAVPDVADPEAARDMYARYVAAADDVGAELTEDEAPLLEHARQRIEDLGAARPDGGDDQ